MNGAQACLYTVYNSVQSGKREMQNTKSPFSLTSQGIKLSLRNSGTYEKKILILFYFSFLNKLNKLTVMRCKFMQRKNEKTLKCLERIKNTIAISAERKVYVQTVRTLHQLNVACNVIAYLRSYAVLIKGLRVCISVLYEIKENSGLQVPKRRKRVKIFLNL